MSSLPIVVVTGATGRQGGSVVDSLVNSGKYHVRAATRDPSSASAQKLLTKYPSVELVTFDLAKKETVAPAFAGAYAVFAVTNYWQPDIMANPQLELDQGKLMADTARDAGVKHFIWSTLDNVLKHSNGELVHAVHFTNKAVVEDYVRAIPEFTSSFVALGCYSENFTTAFWAPKKDADGTWIFSAPIKADTELPLVDTDDTGPTVLAILGDKERFSGKVVEVTGPYITPTEIAEVFTKVTGLPAKYVESENNPQILGNEFSEMCAFFDKCGYYNKRDLEWRDFYNYTTWEEYLKKTNFRPE